MNVNDKVFVVDWGKQYTSIYKWVENKRVCVFPIKTVLPDYCGTEFHWKYTYEPNLTKKGTVNKLEPKKLVSKEPAYMDYKWTVLEVFKHPNAGEPFYPNDPSSGRYSEGDLLLLAAEQGCYIIIEASGVSRLTPEQYADEQFKAVIEANLSKWDRANLSKWDRAKLGSKIPDEIKSVFYDEDDNVLFGSIMTKGLVSYTFIEGKFSTDGKPIYLHSSVDYNRNGNHSCPNPKLIKPFKEIKAYIKQ